MTATTTFNCDFCPATETVMVGDTPTGWWDAPRIGKGGNTGHACPECVLTNDQVMAKLIAERSADTARILDRNPPTG